MKTFLIVIASIILVLALLYMAVGLFFIYMVFKKKDELPKKMMPKDEGTSREMENRKIVKENRAAFQEKISAELDGAEVEMLEMEAGDGITLRGRLYKAPFGGHRYAILCHGYMGSYLWMLPHAYVFRLWGWNALALDMRASGASDGAYAGMGWKDKDDVRKWIDEIIMRDDEAEIVVLGISMGGATAMMLSGLPDLPGNLKAVIEDCGYSSVWNVFYEQFKKTGQAPIFPVLTSADMMMKMKEGWSLKEADSIKMLKKASPDLPMLFMQGEDDSFVPVHMIWDCYGAKKGNKEIKVFPDTDHGSSSVRHPVEYFSTVKTFLEKNGLGSKTEK